MQLTYRGLPYYHQFFAPQHVRAQSVKYRGVSYEISMQQRAIAPSSYLLKYRGVGYSNA